VRELVGQGKPFYSSLDKAAGLLRRKVGTGSEFLKELMSIPGVKQAEIAERGLGELLNAPKMTHEQFLAALGSKPAPAIGEKMLGGDRSEPDSEAPYHEKWTLPGGDNYREMLIKAPKQPDYMKQIETAHNELRNMPYHGRTPEQERRVGQLAKLIREIESKTKELPDQFHGVGAHFGGEPGILASLRLKDRTGPNGEKLLHLEELQSDWHQHGRERGYRKEFDKDSLKDEMKNIIRERAALVKEFTEHASRNNEEITPEMQARWNEFKTREDALEQRKRQIASAVPDAPFKKNWEEMALKRLIHHAAENGYHGIVITPGAEQADRYSLAHHVDEISWSPSEGGRNVLNIGTGPNKITTAYDPKTGEFPRFVSSHFEGKKLAEVVGQEMAKKILAEESGKLSGEGMTVGGEGMKGFYDKKVPNILNSIGKKYGVKTELNGHNLKIREDLNFPEELSRRSNLPAHVPGETKPVHYFPITEEMRQDVKKNGIPLYESGGSVSTQ